MAPQGPPGLQSPTGATGTPAGIQIPTSIISLMSLQSAATAASPTAGQTGLASHLSGPPAGITLAPGATQPPVSFSIPGQAGPPGAHRSPLGSHDGAVVNGVTSMLLVLVVTAVGGRLAARRLANLRIGADDYAALVALVRFCSTYSTLFAQLRSRSFS